MILSRYEEMELNIRVFVGMDIVTPSGLLVVNQLRNSIHQRSDVERVAKDLSLNLRLEATENRMAFLMALSEVETDIVENIPRYEPAYGLSGIYFNKSKIL